MDSQEINGRINQDQPSLIGFVSEKMARFWITEARKAYNEIDVGEVSHLGHKGRTSQNHPAPKFDQARDELKDVIAEQLKLAINPGLKPNDCYCDYSLGGKYDLPSFLKDIFRKADIPTVTLAMDTRAGLRIREPTTRIPYHISYVECDGISVRTIGDDALFELLDEWKESHLPRPEAPKIERSVPCHELRGPTGLQ